jgi:hypothetical protein
MNSNLKFGYSILGRFTLVKLNAKLSHNGNYALSARFPELTFTENGRFGYRIEGCLTESEFYSFREKLAYDLLQSKIETMQEKQKELLGIYPDRYELSGEDLLPY